MVDRREDADVDVEPPPPRDGEAEKRLKPWVKPTLLEIVDGAVATASGPKVDPMVNESTTYRPMS